MSTVQVPPPVVTRRLVPVPPPAESRAPRPAAPTARAPRTDVWPHTTRVLPWLIAVFLVLIWLVPFNSITLSFSTPIDLFPDRLILPVIGMFWIIALCVGGRMAPQVRWTWIHSAIALFVAVSFVSVVINAQALNHTLELNTAMKKLTLLAFYASFFVMIASVVRVEEVRPFLTFTLILAVICALGMIWEYRYAYNVFYEWSAKLLPGGLFHVQLFDPAGVDEIGRRQTRGPAELGLEAASMLAMALPIALVRLMDARRGRERLLYGLAACILLAAAISTYRKTAFIAPVTVILTLVIFRPRASLKLAPLAVVAIVVVHILSPGAFGAIADQLQGHRLAAASTVSDRTSDYDAIRPDVWSHPLLGRGYGGYAQPTYRILDSEILRRLIETGVIGLLAYILMGASVVFASWRTARSGDAVRAGPAMIGACAAVAFLTVSVLFDAMWFPHTPYIFLSFAGLAAVAIAAPETER